MAELFILGFSSDGSDVGNFIEVPLGSWTSTEDEDFDFNGLEANDALLRASGSVSPKFESLGLWTYRSMIIKRFISRSVVL